MVGKTAVLSFQDTGRLLTLIESGQGYQAHPQ